MATKTTKSVSKATTAAKKETKPEVKKEAGLSVSVVDAAGKAGGTVALTPELFGAKVNKELLAQSVRVYLANQREGGARSKTRGMVEGSSRKIYRQKGTGRARHGSIRAHIFVGGGVVFGPVGRDYHLTMTKQMKRGALVSALSAKKDDVIVIDGLEAVEAKTKQVAKSLTLAGATDKVLLVLPTGATGLARAARNIASVNLIGAKELHPYALVTHKKIVFTKKSLEESKAHFTK